MVARIVDDLSPALTSSHARSAGEGTGAPPDDAAILRRAHAGASLSSQQSGYLQYLDHGALVAAARAAGALIVLRFRPGHFVLRGEPLASIVPSSEARRLEAAVHRCVVLGRHRTLAQDSEFVLAQIIEIAIRALSPAINDTFTGVACVDWLADALLALSETPPLEGNWYDATGELRVWMPAVRVERLVKFAFDQIRQASATTPAVLIRQVDMIRRLGPRLPEAARHALAEQLDAIRQGADRLTPLDRQDLDAACERARAAV
jgi:uncharacterized membrane protein